MLLCYFKKSLFRVHSIGDTRQSDWFPSNTTLVMRLFNRAHRCTGERKKNSGLSLNGACVARLEGSGFMN